MTSAGHKAVIAYKSRMRGTSLAQSVPRTPTSWGGGTSAGAAASSSSTGPSEAAARMAHIRKVALKAPLGVLWGLI